MKDLIVVTAHCPTEEQELMLEECINSVIDLNFHVLLISHTHVPLHIQKKCNYYFYDYFNDVNHDDDLLMFVRYGTDKFTIRSKYFTKEFYGFSIYRMFTVAARIAENFGYKNIHHIEYDCVLKNKNLINRHNELLKTYDSIFYTDGGDRANMILGAFKSFNIEKLPKQFRDFDRDEMRKMMTDIPLLPLESFTKHIFTEEGNPLFLDWVDLKSGRDFIQRDSVSRLKFFTPYYNHIEDTFCIFYKNTKNIEDSLRIYVNSKLLKSVIQPGSWAIRTLCSSSELESLLILSNGKIIYDKTYDADGRETLKKNAYLIDEKDR